MDGKLSVMVAISQAVCTRQEPFATVAFLEKFYKRNLSTSHRINEVRLVRFNGLLKKACGAFAQLTAKDVEAILLQCCCLVNKISSHSPDEDKLRILSVSYHWMGKLVPLAASHSPECARLVIELLEYLLRAKKLQIPPLEEYMETLNRAEVLKAWEVTAKDESQANSQKSPSVVLEDADEATSLLRQTDLVALFRSLLAKHPNYQEVLQLLLVCQKKMPVGSKIQFFWKTVVEPLLNDGTQAGPDGLVKMLEYAIAKGEFDLAGRQRLNNTLFELNSGLIFIKASHQHLNIPDNIKKSATPDLLKQLVALQNSPLATIELFESPSVESYAPLSLILKGNFPIPKEKLELMFKLKELPNRKAIVIAFLIWQQRKSIPHDLLKLYSLIKEPNKAQRLRTIHFLHFSLQANSQTQLLARIMELIPADKLNEECDFSFLPLMPLDKFKFDRPEKTLISSMVSQEIGPNEVMYRVKIDLLALLGEANTLPTIIEDVAKFTTKKPDEMIEALLTVNNDTLLELLLMKINKTFESTDVGEVSPKIIEWAIKAHARHTDEYRKATKKYFASMGLDGYTHLALAIKSWNIASKDKLGLPSLSSFLNTPERETCLDDNYVNFIIRVPNSSPLDQCLRAQSRVRELETFIGYLDEKHFGKKEFKKIMEANNTPQIFLLQAISAYFDARVSHPELLKSIISKLNPDAEVQEQAEKKLEEYEINIEGIENAFEPMLKEAYPEALSFICKLVKSKNPKDNKQTKSKKKSKKDKEDTKDFPTRVFTSFLDCLPAVLVSPQQIGSNFQQLIETIDKLIKLKCADEIFADHLIGWVSKFRALSMETYEFACQNVANLKNFWISAEKVIADRIPLTDIEEQVDYITKLLVQVRQYSSQPKYEQLYNNLLTILHVLLSLQQVQQSEGTIAKLPRHKLRTLPEKYRVKPSNDGMYFFCQTCQKNVCESCSSFMHRNHDKSYVNKDKGTCSHQNDQRKNNPNPTQKNRLEEELDEQAQRELAADPERLAQYRRYEKERERDRRERERQRERERERELQAIRLKEELLLSYHAQAAARQQGNPHTITYLPGSSYGIFSAGYGGSSYPLPAGTSGMISLPLAQASQLIGNPNPVSQLSPPVITTIESEDNLELKSTTQKSIVECVGRYSGQFLNPLFVQQPPEGSEGPGNRVSMAGLLAELMQAVEQQSIKRYREKEHDGETNGSLEKFSFDPSSIQVVMEDQREKYIMFKINGSRNGEDEEYEKRGRSIPNRALVCSNGKILAIKIPADGADLLMFYHESKLRRSLKKRQRTKKFGETESEGSFQIDRRQQIINFEIISMSFSKKNPSLLLVCGDTNFHLYTIAEGRESRKTTYPNSIMNDRIIKAAWVPDSASRIVVATSKEVRVYEIIDSSANPNLRIISRYPSMKPITDFHIAKQEDTPVMCLYITDNEGSIFLERIGNEDERGNVLSNKVPINGFDASSNVTSFFMSEQSGLGLLSLLDGSNVLCRMRDNTLSKIIDLRLQALIPPSSDSFSVLKNAGHLITNAKLLFSSKEAAIIICLLKKKDQPSGGNVAIIQLSGTNAVNIQCLNGNHHTDSFEVISYDDDEQTERFIVIGMQSDATMWMKPYEVRTPLTQSSKQQDLPEDKIDEFNKQINDKQLLRELGEGGNRKVDFREISSKFNSMNMNEVLGEKLIVTINAHVFVTGLVMRVDTVGMLSFSLFDREYEFNIRHPRQVQIPLSLKETLQVFTTRTITINIAKKFAVQVYVVPWDKPSVYNDAYRQIVRLYTDHYGFDRKDAKNYFSNPQRSDFMNIGQEALQKIFKDNKLEPSESSFILEMELLIQCLDRNGMPLSLTQLEQFLTTIKPFLLIDKPILKATVNRLFRKVFWLYRIVAVREGRSVSLGDAYDYYTFKDLFWVEKLYRDFLNKTNLWRLDQLLEKLHRLKYKRLANLYLMFGVFPKMLTRICEFYRRELENCLEGSRQRMNERITLIVRLLCEHYQYNKNRGNVDSEIQAFYLLELLLSSTSKNKEIYKDIILRACHCFEAVPMHKASLEFSYGCRLFEVTASPMDRNILPNTGASIIEEENIIEEEQKRSEEEEESEMRPYEDLEWGLPRSPLLPASTRMVVQGEPSAEDVAIPLPVSRPSTLNKLINQYDLAKHLSQQRNHTEVSVTYFDIIYELTISLFKIENRIKPENSILYIGLLFNLVSLLDVRLNQYPRTTAHKMVGQLVEAVNQRLKTAETPSLYIVLAHFMEPNYDELRHNGKPVDEASEGRKLKRYIINYYKEAGVYEQHLKSLLVQKLPPLNAKSLTLKQAFFNEVDISSHVYQIKYLGNIYLNLLLSNIRPRDPLIKDYILKGYVKDRLRVLKNILVIEGWNQQLDRMKFEVAFQELRQKDFANGFTRLEVISKKQPDALVSYLGSDISRLEFLEELLSNNAASRYFGMLMEVLSLYYQSV